MIFVVVGFILLLLNFLLLLFDYVKTRITSIYQCKVVDKRAIVEYVSIPLFKPLISQVEIYEIKVRVNSTEFWIKVDPQTYSKLKISDQVWVLAYKSGLGSIRWEVVE